MTAKRTRLPWETVVERYLLPYREEHGDLLVPVAYITPDGYRLGDWVRMQRVYKRRGTLPHDREERLSATPGWVWTVRSPATWFDAATEYHAEHGDLHVPHYYVTPDGIPLGRRINNARQSWQQGVLSAQTHAFLDGLDPTWVRGEGATSDRVCAVPDCEDAHATKGLCRYHYNQLLTHGVPFEPPVSVECVVGPCSRRASEGAWCATHHARLMEGHGRSAYRTRNLECQGRCEVCKADHIRERAELRQREIERDILPFEVRRALIGDLWSGMHLDEACGRAGLTAGRLWTISRSVPGLTEALDTALLATRDPHLTHGKEHTYKKYRCRCPECRAAKLGGER
jgi:hypothetical protein